MSQNICKFQIFIKRREVSMEISVLQAFLIGIVYYLGINGTPWLTCMGSTIIQKPLVSGLIVGIILGDPLAGAIIGAAINLPFIAYISAGGAPPTDPGLAGTLGTALALAAGVSPAVAITIAVPLGLLGTIIWVVHMTVDVFFVHMIDKCALNGDMKKACFLHVVPPQIIAFIIGVIPVALGCYYGAGVVSNIIATLDGTPLKVLEVIGGILPAIGIAMNLRAISKPGILLWFILGFVVTVYLGLTTMPVAIIAGIVAYLYTGLTANAATVSAADDDF
jgi:PTS system mannose-specific IIC component